MFCMGMLPQTISRCFSLGFTFYAPKCPLEDIQNTIKWDFVDLEKRILFQNSLSTELESINIDIPICDGTNCNIADHHAKIDSFFERI